jgi:hypothetical protein
MTSGLRVLLTALLSVAMIGCQEKKRDIVNDMYPEEQKKLESIVNDIYVTAKKKDLARLEAFHLVTPKFSKFEQWGVFERRNREETVKSENAIFSALSKYDYQVQDFRADVFGDVAVTTFHFKFDVIMGDKPIAGRLRATLVFVKDGNDWKIVHEHFSDIPPVPSNS